jgi:hypothetical protein
MMVNNGTHAEVHRDSCAMSGDAAAISNGKKPRRGRPSSNKSTRQASIDAAPAREKLMHVCDFTECRLPAEDWYKRSKAPRT